MIVARTKPKKEAMEFPIIVHQNKCTGCRTCQVMCSIRNLGEFNPLKSYLVITRDHGKKTTSLDFTGDCTWCGYCARFCSYGALVLKKLVKSETGR